MTNPRFPEQRGAPKNGVGLLQGLVICGKCGNRMHTKYIGRTNFSYYRCERGHKRPHTPCWTVTTRAIDEAVEKCFLEAMTPSEVNLSFAVARQVEQQASKIDDHWQQRLERARYTVRQAERRYRAVDAENRLVARTLEQEWEESLRALAETEQEMADARRAQHLVLDDGDRKAVLALAKDLPRVWRAKSTTQTERKTMLRMVVREVILRPVDVPRRCTAIHINWHTGHSTTLEVPRSGRGVLIKTEPAALEALRALSETGLKDREIADELNARGICTGTGKEWNAARVAQTRLKNGIRKVAEANTTPERREDGAYSVRGLAAALGVSTRTIYAWQRLGVLVGERANKNPRAPWWFPLDDEAMQKLKRLVS